MTEPLTHCPFVGLGADRTLLRNAPDTAHRCYALRPPGTPDVHYQSSFCLGSGHTQCPFFQAPQTGSEISAVNGPRFGVGTEHGGERKAGIQRWLPLVVWAVVGILACVVAFVYLQDSGMLGAVLPRPQPAQATATPVAAGALPSPAATPETQAPSQAVAISPTRYRFSTPTPEAGGRTVTLTAKSGEAGWWTGGEGRGNHLGDSFLYAGYVDAQPFISAMRFDLSGIPRGAPIRSAQLRLTGLKDDRFDAAAGGTWSVQVAPAASLPDFSRADFQTLFNLPPAVTLFPSFFAADLGKGRANVAAFDEGGRAWLESQLRDGNTGVIVRIVGPGGGDSLFAWDSGSGPASSGEGPQLVLALGPAPATAPPLPTEAVLVATDTPTPANILTAVVHALGATATAEAGTPAFRYVTPTPSPANIATLQARALIANLPPIVPDTPTPATEQTAEAQRLLATAEAFLTGTPTPPPPGFVKPVIITPTPVPANVMTAAAEALTATAEPARGTPTPWPYNWIIATVTPPVFVIVDTPTPANEATATIRAAYATAITILTGTFTPFPFNAVTATPAATSSAVAATATLTPAPAATPRPGNAPRPTATRRGAKPAATPTVPAAACTDPRVQISAPKSGAIASEQLEVRGRAASEAFVAYVVEFARGALPASGYEEVFRSENPVEDGVLGSFVLTALPNGTYTLSLRVLTSAGDAAAPCRVVIQVLNQ